MFMPGILFIRQQGIRLIDWEYAGDGDVALELAAVWTESDAARQTLISDYARWRTLTPTRWASGQALAALGHHADGWLV
jgi:thiamine kinase-like enzyme